MFAPFSPNNFSPLTTETCLPVAGASTIPLLFPSRTPANEPDFVAQQILANYISTYQKGTRRVEEWGSVNKSLESYYVQRLAIISTCNRHVCSLLLTHSLFSILLHLFANKSALSGHLHSNRDSTSSSGTHVTYVRPMAVTDGQTDGRTELTALTWNGVSCDLATSPHRP